MSSDLIKPSSQIRENLAKRWLDKNANMFRVGQKLIAAFQNNNYNLKLLIGYFETYKVINNWFRILLTIQ